MAQSSSRSRRFRLTSSYSRCRSNCKSKGSLKSFGEDQRTLPLWSTIFAVDAVQYLKSCVTTHPNRMHSEIAALSGQRRVAPEAPLASDEVCQRAYRSVPRRLMALSRPPVHSMFSLLDSDLRAKGLAEVSRTQMPRMFDGDET